MKDEITKIAKKKLDNIRGFQILAIIFLSVSIILFVIGLQLHPSTRFWINFPTLPMLMVLGIVYVSMFGFKNMRDYELGDENEDLEREIARIYTEQTDGLQLKEDINLEDRLDLLELERIKDRVKIREDNS